MAAELITLPFRPVINTRGVLEPGALLDVFQAGTTTRISVFSDSDLSAALSNPVVANSSGVFPSVYWDNVQAVRVRVREADGTVLGDADPYFSDGLTSTDLSFIQSGTGATSRTVQAKLRDTVSVKDFGAVGDGTTNDTAAIQAAIDAIAAAGGGAVLVPRGNYRLQSTLTIPGLVRLVGEGAGRVAQPVQAASTVFSWYGGAAEMVRLGWQAGVRVGGGIESIRLDGRALATQCLSFKDIQQTVVSDIVLTGATSAALYMTNTALAADPTGFCTFNGIRISLRGGATDSAHGILIEGAGTGVAGVTLCSWRDVRIEHANGDGVRVVQRGDGMTWYNLFTFRAGVETGFGIRAQGDAAAVVSAWSFVNCLPNGGVQIDTPNIAKNWVFDNIQDIDVDASAIALVYGQGRADVAVVNTASTRTKGPTKIGGYRNPRIKDGMIFRRWDSGNNILQTAENSYLTGGTYSSALIASADQPGGAIALTTGNVSGNALYFSAVGAFASGFAPVREPQMAVSWTPISTTNYVARAGFVGSYADLPDNGIYVEAAPTTSGFYRCITRNGGTETATVTSLALAVLITQWRIEYNGSSAVFLYRTSGNNLWAVAATHTTNIPTATLADIFYMRTTEAVSKAMHAYDYALAWDLEA